VFDFNVNNVYLGNWIRQYICLIIFVWYGAANYSVSVLGVLPRVCKIKLL
jgi:hypothetical protein